MPNASLALPYRRRRIEAFPMRSVTLAMNINSFNKKKKFNVCRTPKLCYAGINRRKKGKLRNVYRPKPDYSTWHVYHGSKRIFWANQSNDIPAGVP